MANDWKVQMKLHIMVVDIRGNCPIYKVGDEFTIEHGFVLHSKIPLCMHSLSSLVPYYIPLSRGIQPKDLGLGDTEAYIQCLDPCKYTGGGTVVFKITKEDE